MAGDVYISFGADTGDLEAALAVARQQVVELNGDMRDLAQQMLDTGASADSDLGQRMTALGGKLNEAKGHVAGLKDELKGVGESAAGSEIASAVEREGGLFAALKEKIEGVTAPVNGLIGSFSELIEVIATAFAIEKIAEWASEIQEAFEQIDNEAHKLGVSLEQVQQLQAISTLSGTDYGELSSQMERLQLSLAKAGSAATPAGEALKALGVNIGTFRTQSVTEQLDTLAEKFAKFADGPNKTAIAIALLGRAGADLIPLLDKGGEGMDELREAAQRTLIDDLLALFGGRSQPVMAHLVESGKLSLEDIKEAERTVRALARKKEQ